MLAALTNGPDLMEVVGSVLSLFGVIGQHAPVPPQSAVSVSACGAVLLALVIAVVIFHTTRWAARKPSLGKSAALLAVVAALLALFGTGGTAIYQHSVGWPIHLTPRAALAGIPLAVLALVVAVLLLLVDD